MLRNNKDIEIQFFKSALATDSGIMSNTEILAWVASKKLNVKTCLKQIPLDQMRCWSIDPKTGITSAKDTANNINRLNVSLSELGRWLNLFEGSFASSTLVLIVSLFKRDYIPLVRWLKLYLMRWIPFCRQLKTKINLI